MHAGKIIEHLTNRSGAGVQDARMAFLEWVFSLPDDVPMCDAARIELDSLTEIPQSGAAREFTDCLRQARFALPPVRRGKRTHH